MKAASPLSPQDRKLAEDAAGHIIAKGLIKRTNGSGHDTLQLLAAMITIHRFDAEHEIFREGELGDALYVLLDGKCDVIIRGTEDKPRSINKIGPGNVFGEQSIGKFLPLRRSATIQTITPVICGRLARANYRMLADDTTQNMVERLGQNQSASRLRQVSQLLKDIPETAFLETPMQPIDFVHGGRIYSPGDPSDTAFIIMRGRVQIFADLASEPLAAFTSGLIFGQVGIGTPQPRTVAAVAEKDTLVFSIRSDDWHRLADLPEHGAALHATLANVYTPHGRGHVYIREHNYGGALAVTTDFHLPDGRRVGAVRIPDHHAFRMTLKDGVAMARHHMPAPPGNSREVALDATGRIVEIVSQGEWPTTLGSLCGRLLDNMPLEVEEIAALEAGALLPPPYTIACACMAISEDLATQVGAGGAVSDRGIMVTCGAGAPCGACTQDIRTLLVHGAVHQ